MPMARETQTLVYDPGGILVLAQYNKVLRGYHRLEIITPKLAAENMLTITSQHFRRDT